MSEDRFHRDRIEQRLNATEERFRIAQAAGGIGWFEWDLETDAWECTSHVAALFGFDPVTPRRIFADWAPAIFADDMPKLRSAIESAGARDPYYVEFRVRHPDGGVHWIAGKGEIAKGETGRPRRLAGVFYDISERKALEARLLAANETLEARVAERARQLAATSARLEETERRFHLLIDAVTDYAIFMLDASGHVISWNPGAERIKGYSAAEIIGQHFSRFYTEEDRQKGVPQTALATAERTGKYEAEGRRCRKDGTTFMASVVLNAIRDESGQLLGFAKVTRDITERKATEEQLRQAQKMEAIGQLTGGVAHDFNNLLTVMMGNLEHLDRILAPAQSTQRIIASALRAGSRAAILTHRLLAFSRRQALAPEVLSVNKLVAGMSELMRRTLGETILVEAVLAGGLWSTFADANQLENALINLAVNARDAMPEGGKLTIETANAHLDEAYARRHGEVEAGQYVAIFVTDTGTGMAPEVVAHAFEPFFTTKETGQGTGLGLSQVYGFIKQSGGHVKIYSEEGEGTTVKLYLPRYRGADAIVADSEETYELPRGRAELVLVVEDDPDVRDYTVEMVGDLGYSVLSAADGASALRLLDSHREISLLFTDVGLPGGMNGRQLAEQALRRQPRLKVLFTTGYARNAIIHQGRLDPGVEIVFKPFTYSDLAMKIRQVLD
ncbi:MAG: PAS domain S-box protein, partial [Bryobacterales bacterium]|nr:PAS domain S-box protein [Bryobacterales bacterium]